MSPGTEAVENSPCREQQLEANRIAAHDLWDFQVERRFVQIGPTTTIAKATAVVRSEPPTVVIWPHIHNLTLMATNGARDSDLRRVFEAPSTQGV